VLFRIGKVQDLTKLRTSPLRAYSVSRVAGGGGGQVVTEGVRVVAAEEVGHVNESAAALAELAPAEVGVFMVTMHKSISP
jgi:hypothetical protein